MKLEGVVIIIIVWSWRYHPVPVDYWRFSHDCLDFLFEGLTCIDKGFDISERRKNITGFSNDGSDNAPIDELKSWRENWRLFYVGRKSLIKNEKQITSEKISYDYISKNLKRYSQNDNLITSFNYQKDWLIKGINLNIQKDEGYKKDQTSLKIEENNQSKINFIA